MAVNNSYSPQTYTGNGSTTAFTVPWKFLSGGDLTVTTTPAGGGTPTTLVLGTGYTVSGAGVDTGGTVTFTTAPASQVTITISRTTALTQPTSFANQGAFYPSLHEAAYDRSTLIQQEAAYSLGLVTNPPSASVTQQYRQSALSALLAFNSFTTPTGAAYSMCVTGFPSSSTYQGNTQAMVYVGAGGAAYSTPYLCGGWASRTSGTTNDLNSVASNGSLVVAVGAAGTIVTTPDGGTWTVRTSGTSNALRQVLWLSGYNKWLAVGDSGTVIQSADGITWISVASGQGTTTLYGAAYGSNGTIVAVGAPHQTAAFYSTNGGVNWTSQTPPTSGGFGTNGQMVTFLSAPSLFAYADSAGNIYTSPDGTTWTGRGAPLGAASDVVLGTIGTIAVAVATNGVLATSYDGATWTKRQATTTGGSYGLWNALGLPNGALVIYGGGGNANHVVSDPLPTP